MKHSAKLRQFNVSSWLFVLFQGQPLQTEYQRGVSHTEPLACSDGVSVTAAETASG